MSDQEVVAALEAMEQLLLQGESVEPQAFTDWRKRFDDAVATAERGPGWAEIVTRAHLLAKKAATTAEALSVHRDELRTELNLQSQGARALQAYKPS